MGYSVSETRKNGRLIDFLSKGSSRTHGAFGLRIAIASRRASWGYGRVGVDQRSRTPSERESLRASAAGIYALCEVESEAFPGTGANDEFWAIRIEPGVPGWPTIKIRYLRTYQENPLTIDTLRAAKPEISPLLLDGFQAASFPISSEDFHAIMEFLGENPDSLP